MTILDLTLGSWLARELQDELANAAAPSFSRPPTCGAPATTAPRCWAPPRADVAAQNLYMLVRDMLGRLRPAQLDALGLQAALQELCEAGSRPARVEARAQAAA